MSYPSSRELSPADYSRLSKKLVRRAVAVIAFLLALALAYLFRVA
jgi:hypothetical protein